MFSRIFTPFGHEKPGYIREIANVKNISDFKSSFPKIIAAENDRARKSQIAIGPLKITRTQQIPNVGLKTVGYQRNPSRTIFEIAIGPLFFGRTQ